MVGFSPRPTHSRVYVRTDGPVRWRVFEETATTVILELIDTGIGSRNNTLPLQTGFFETAVQKVQASPGPGRTVRLRIDLARAVPYRVSQDGDVVAVDFQLPGG